MSTASAYKDKETEAAHHSIRSPKVLYGSSHSQTTSRWAMSHPPCLGAISHGRGCYPHLPGCSPLTVEGLALQLYL